MAKRKMKEKDDANKITAHKSTDIKPKPASVQALEATPVAILIDHLCGRLVDYAFLGEADRFRSYCMAYDVAKVVDAVLVRMGDMPQLPTDAEKMEFEALIPEGVPKNYQPFRCTSNNPDVEERLQKARKDRTQPNWALRALIKQMEAAGRPCTLRGQR
jgi:hypothetical protein